MRCPARLAGPTLARGISTCTPHSCAIALQLIILSITILSFLLVALRQPRGMRRRVCRGSRRAFDTADGVRDARPATSLRGRSVFFGCGAAGAQAAGPDPARPSAADSGSGQDAPFSGPAAKLARSAAHGPGSGSGGPGDQCVTQLGCRAGSTDPPAGRFGGDDALACQAIQRPAAAARDRRGSHGPARNARVHSVFPVSGGAGAAAARNSAGRASPCQHSIGLHRRLLDCGRKRPGRRVGSRCSCSSVGHDGASRPVEHARELACWAATCRRRPRPTVACTTV